MSRVSSAALLLLLAVPAGAAERTLTLAPADTTIAFELDATGHVVHGTFALRAGEVRFDTEAGTASGRIVIDARSGKTGNEKRDKKMAKQVLQVESHPEIVFVPESVKGDLVEGETRPLVLHGTVTLLGGGHPADLVCEVHLQGGSIDAKGTMEIPYVSWGMEDPSVLFLRVAKVVEVTVGAKGRLLP